MFLVVSAAPAWTQPQPAVTGYPIPTPLSVPAGIATGPDGALWFTELAGKIGRITTGGEISEFPLPGNLLFPGGIVSGPDGALWFTEAHAAIGRMTTAGEYSEFPIPNLGTFAITAGSDNALWFTDPFGPNIGRITTSGTVTEYPLPSVSRIDNASAMVSGPDGALWFIVTKFPPEGEFFNVIGRMTTAGVVTEYAVPQIAIVLTSIAVGADGAVWFAGNNGFVGRITTDGTMTEYLLPSYLAEINTPPSDELSAITAGADGSLWFTAPFYFGQLTSSGAVKAYPIPSALGMLVNSGIVTGPDGNVWFICPDGNAIERVSIFASAQLQITSAPNLPPATANTPYYWPLVSAGGTWPFSWSLISGTLAPGLSLSATGVITGTPTNAGFQTVVVQVTDASGASATQTFTLAVNQAGCSYAINPSGQVFPAAGGSSSLAVSATPGCPWTVSGVPSWITISSGQNGVGNGTITFTVGANYIFSPLEATLAIAGMPFVAQVGSTTVESAPGLGVPVALPPLGAAPEVLVDGGWSTTFTLVNKGASTATVETDLFGSDGTPLAAPISVPEEPAAEGTVVASALDQAIPPGAILSVMAAGPASLPFLEGSAQLFSNGTVDGFAVLHMDPSAQEATVPLQSNGPFTTLLPFDNTNGVSTALALGNLANQTANVPVILRDDSGARIGSGTETVTLAANGHASFMLSQEFPVTANTRGTIQIETGCSFQPLVCSALSAVGIRYTPAGTLTTIPPTTATEANGIFPHIASGDGWQTTFVLVNLGTSAAPTLTFFDDSGNALPLDLTFPQTGSSSGGSFTGFSQTIAAGASLWIETSGPLGSPLLTGSAHLSSTNSIAAYAIYRYMPNGQEAVVPLEVRNAKSYLLAFDNTAGIVTGVAISAKSPAPVSVPVILRDDAGAQIATSLIPLAANGHLSESLSALLPAAAGIRGTVEFDTPAGAQISVLGIRSPPTLTFTSISAGVKIDQ